MHSTIYINMLRHSRFSRNDFPWIVRRHFTECGAWYAACLLFFVAGMCAGAFSNVKIFILDKTIPDIFVRKTFFSCFAGLVVELLILKTVAVLVNFHIASLPLGFLFIMFKGFLVGRNAVLVINYLNLGGILFVFLFYIPFQAVVCFAVFGWFIIFMRRNCFCFRGHYHGMIDFKATFLVGLWFLTAAILLAVVYSLIYAYLYSTVIVFRL